MTGWVESIQRDVPVNGVLTDANLKFGVFDMSARVTQAGQVVWQQFSYNWCVRRRRQARSAAFLLSPTMHESIWTGATTRR